MRFLTGLERSSSALAPSPPRRRGGGGGGRAAPSPWRSGWSDTTNAVGRAAGRQPAPVGHRGAAGRQPRRRAAAHDAGAARAPEEAQPPEPAGRAAIDVEACVRKAVETARAELHSEVVACRSAADVALALAKEAKAQAAAAAAAARTHSPPPEAKPRALRPLEAHITTSFNVMAALLSDSGSDGEQATEPVSSTSAVATPDDVLDQVEKEPVEFCAVLQEVL